MSIWKIISQQPPPKKMVVRTKLDDGNGIRNEQELVWDGKLWWLPDMRMYVYYTPTHWCI